MRTQPLLLLLLIFQATPLRGTHSWCGSSCRKGAKRLVEAELASISTTFCPKTSHGLYALHADLKADPKKPRGMDLDVNGRANEVCASVEPPIPRTQICVHPPESDTIISKGVVWRGHWAVDCNEEYRLRTLCAIVKAVRTSKLPRVWVLDIGANIGTFTLPLVAAGVNVLAFEADPLNAALLNGSLAAQRHMHAQASVPPPPLGEVRLVSGALAATAGGQLCIRRESERNSGSSRLDFAGAATSSSSADGPCRHVVRTITLDQAVEAELGMSLGPVGARQGSRAADGAAIVAAKIDVQGAEAHVLAGATRLLRESPPHTVYMETKNRTLLAALTSSLGYSQRSGRKDGCDDNVRLVLDKLRSSTS